MEQLLDASALYDQYAFQNALPIPDVIDTSKHKTITLQVQEIEQFLGLYGQDGLPLYTTVWGYGTGQNASYPGPTILAYQDQPITVNWQNMLPVDGHLLPVDTSLHMAEPIRRPLEAGFVPIVTHLHGGHNDSAYDGLPDQWFTQSKGGPGGTGPREVGPEFVTSRFHYDNDQQAATLWYHDHALGLTRLNVYAGLAGFYILQDQERLDLVNDGVLPGGPYDIGMAIPPRSGLLRASLLRASLLPVAPRRSDPPHPRTGASLMGARWSTRHRSRVPCAAGAARAQAKGGGAVYRALVRPGW
jgi:spore coat protein A